MMTTRQARKHKESDRAMMTTRQARKTALDYAIFALNTLEAPDASAQDDLDDLDSHSHWTISHLVDMRDELQGEPVPVTGWDKAELTITMVFDWLLTAGSFFAGISMIRNPRSRMHKAIFAWVMLENSGIAVHSAKLRARARGEDVSTIPLKDLA